MNRLGMLVDISHVSPDVMRRLLDLSEAPSSSPIRGARPGRSSPQRAGRRAGAGWPGTGDRDVTFIPSFVSAETAAWGKGLETSIFNGRRAPRWSGSRRTRRLHGPAPIATLARSPIQFEHVAHVAGRDHVGIGSDFYGSADEPSGLADVRPLPRPSSPTSSDAAGPTRT